MGAVAVPAKAVAPVKRKSLFRRRARLEVFDDLYHSADLQFKPEPTIELRDLHSITLYALGGNSEAIHVAFSQRSARARKFVTLNAGGQISIAVSDSREMFDLVVYVKNSTTNAEQGLFVFGLRPKEE